MSEKKLIDDTHLSNIANAIRTRTGKTDQIQVQNLAFEINNIDTYRQKLLGRFQADNTTLTRLTAAELQGCTSIRSQAFRMCSALEEIELPDTITGELGKGAFKQTAIKNAIHIGKPTSIGQCCFELCTSLVNVVISETVTAIGQNAFNGDTALTTVECRATTPPALGGNVFKDCPLKYIYVPAESVDAYKAASGWSAYADIIEAIPSERRKS